VREAYTASHLLSSQWIPSPSCFPHLIAVLVGDSLIFVSRRSPGRFFRQGTAHYVKHHTTNSRIGRPNFCPCGLTPESVHLLARSPGVPAREIDTSFGSNRSNASRYSRGLRSSLFRPRVLRHPAKRAVTQDAKEATEPCEWTLERHQGLQTAQSDQCPLTAAHRQDGENSPPVDRPNVTKGSDQPLPTRQRSGE
jgi:hypothetical protein